MSGIIGSLLLILISLPRLLAVDQERLHYGWYTSAGGGVIDGLVLDQVSYLSLADHFSGRLDEWTRVQPFTSRALAPWVAGHLGGSALTALWLVNVACLVAGTFALARLAQHLTGSRRGTMWAVGIWAISIPVFWSTGKAFVDAAAVGLMACALLPLYRRRLIPGLILLVLAVWAKETALVLVPLAVGRELLYRPDDESAGPEAGRKEAGRWRWRWARAAAWVVAGLVALATAGLLAPDHEVTFAPWLPSSIDNALRFIAMNFGSAPRLGQFVLTAAPAVAGSVLWWRSRRSDHSFLADRDAFPLVVGTITSVLLSLWSIVAALWDSRTVWTSLPFGALLLGSWIANRPADAVRPSRRDLVRTTVKVGATGFAVLVVWVAIGAVVNGIVTSGTSSPLRDIEPRFASADLMARPTGRTGHTGQGDGTIPVAADGPVLLRFESTEPVGIGLDDRQLLRTPAPAGTVLLDVDGPSDVSVTTTGRWTATVLPTERALFWEGLSPLSGHGPQVLVFPDGQINSLEVAAGPDVRLDAAGRCRQGACGELRRSESGHIVVPAGTEAITVDAAGDWTLVPDSVTDADSAEVLRDTRSG